MTRRIVETPTMTYKTLRDLLTIRLELLDSQESAAKCKRYFGQMHISRPEVKCVLIRIPHLHLKDNMQPDSTVPCLFFTFGTLSICACIYVGGINDMVHRPPVLTRQKQHRSVDTARHLHPTL